MSETDQHMDSGDYTYSPYGGGGWTCVTCGQWVPDDVTHLCPTAEPGTSEPEPLSTMPEYAVVTLAPADFKTTDMLILEALQGIREKMDEFVAAIMPLIASAILETEENGDV